MAQETTYTIGQLAAAAGVTTRTIRYYSAEGLLPPPDARGRYARYAGTHLRRLQLIGKLKSAFLPLSAIKTRLAMLTEAQIEALLAGDAGALTTYAARESESERTALPTADRLSDTEEATGYLQQILAARPFELPNPRPVRSASRRRILLVSPRLAPPADRTAERTELPRTATETLPFAEVASAQTWLRIPLAAGAELHLRAPETPEECASLDRLIAEAKALFRSLA